MKHLFPVHVRQRVQGALGRSTLMLAITMMISCPFATFAKEGSIRAIVGDDIITDLDIDKRFHLIASSSQLPAGVDKTKLAPQIIQKLIDEKLINQEAQRLKIAVTKQDINHAIGVIEKQNHVPEGQLDAFFKDKNVPKDEFFEQLKSQIVWTKVINYTVRPKITVSQNAIDTGSIKKPAISGETTLGLRQMVLPIQANETKASIHSRAAALEQVRAEIEGCSNFDAIASKIRAQSSEVIKVALNNLQPALRDMVKNIPVGKTSPVFTTPSGVQLIVVCSIENSATENAVESAPDKTQVGEMLHQKQLELQAKRYLRDLKQKTYIEIMS